MYKSGTSTLMISGALKPVKTFTIVYHWQGLLVCRSKLYSK